MKKRITSLLLCAVMLLGVFGMSACSYNWEADAAKSVNLDFAQILAASLRATKDVPEVTQALFLETMHDLAVANGYDKQEKQDGEVLASSDSVSFTISSVKDGDTTKNPSTTSYSYIDLSADDSSQNVLVKAILSDIRANIAERKVNDTVKKDDGTTTAKTYEIKVNVAITSTTSNGKTTYTYAAGNTEVTVTYQVTAAKKPAGEVKVENGDIVTLYFISKTGSNVSNTHNWNYTFPTSSSGTGTLGGSKVTFDPDATKGDTGIPADFYQKLIGQSLRTDAKERAKDGLMMANDVVYLTISTATYGSEKKPVSDLKDKTVTLKLNEVNTNAFYEAIRLDILNKIETFKLGASSSATKSSVFIIDGKVYKDAGKATLYTATDKNAAGETVEGQTLTLNYTVSKAYGAAWEEVTVGDTTYSYYLSGIKKIDEVEFEDMTNSSVANGTAYSDGTGDYKNTDTRYLYLYKSEEYKKDADGKDTKEVLATHYYNYYFGKYYFTVLADGSYQYDKNEMKEEKKDYIALSYTFLGDTEETAINTEALALRYAVEKGLWDYDEYAREKYGVLSVWKKVQAAATVEEGAAPVVTVPQTLLDSYYNEFYQNARYTFYKTGKKTSSGTVKIGSVEYKNFDEYFLKQSGAKEASGIRAAVDEKAKDDLIPRLLIYALADQLDVTVTKDEYNTAVSNSFSGWYQNYINTYYNYYSYYSAFGYSSVEQMMEAFGYPTVSNIDEYVEKVLGGETSARTGILFDKVMKKVYEERESFGLSFTYQAEE